MLCSVVSRTKWSIDSRVYLRKYLSPDLRSISLIFSQPRSYVPTPTRTVLSSCAPSNSAAPGRPHPFVLLMLYPASPCSQQKGPLLSNRSHVAFEHLGCGAAINASVQFVPAGQHAVLSERAHVYLLGQQPRYGGRVTPQSISRLGRQPVSRRIAQPASMKGEDVMVYSLDRERK